MKNISWILDELMSDPYYGGSFYKTLNELNEDVIVHGDNGFFDFTNLKLEDDRLYIVYGSLQFVQAITKEFENVVSFGPNSKYDFNYYSTLIPSSLLINQNHSIVTLASLTDDYQRNKLIGLYGNEVFIRPNTFKKIFSGQIVNISDRKSIERFLNPNGGSPSSLIIVSPKANVEQEYRFFVSSTRGILSGSTYQPDKREEVCEWPMKAEQKALEVMSHNLDMIDQIMVIDIGLVNGEYKLVEINCASSSGVYASVTKSIIEEMKRIIVEEQNM